MITATPPTAARLAADPAPTDATVRAHVVAGIRYLATQLADPRVIADDVDEATAELARAELCRWVAEGTRTVEGTRLDRDEVRRIAACELDLLTCGTSGAFRARRLLAGELFMACALDAPFASTLAAQACGRAA